MSGKQFNTGKRNNNYKNQSSKPAFPSRTWKEGDKLTLFPPLPSSTGGSVGLDHNLFQWEREWSVKIGKYGETYRIQFNDGVAEPYDPTGDLDDNNFEAEVSIIEAAFTYTDEQIAELIALDGQPGAEYLKQNKKARWFEEWQIARCRLNARIKQDNVYKDARIKAIAAKEVGDKDKSALIFADVFASMSEASQRLVRNWKAPAISADMDVEVATTSSVGMSQAERQHDWIWLFKAARDTHLRRVNMDNQMAHNKRILNEKAYLQSMYHEKGSFTKWVEKFKDQLEVLEAIQADISDLDKRTFFMNNLNKEIFKKTLIDWSNIRQNSSFPDNFDELVTYVSDEYLAICQENIQDVLKVERGKKDEMMFAGKESTGKSTSSGKAKCEICGNNHNTEDCKWRNDKFSVKSNKEYFLRDQKRKTADTSKVEDGKKESGGKTDKQKSSGSTDESKWNPTKGTVAKPPVTETTKVAFEELTYSVDEIDARLVTNQAEEESSYVIKDARPDQYIFIYDTASTSGALVPGYEGAVKDTYREEARIVGQGGGSQLSTTAGINTFGRFRQLKSKKDNQNLISHAQAEVNWQIHHIRPRYMQLHEWPWSKFKTGKVWHLYSDPEVWGDAFPRLVISADELPDLLMSSRNVEGCLTFYEPPLPPTEDLISEDQLKIINKVDSIHLRTSHTGAAALKRIIKSEEESAVSDPTSLLGITTADVELWEKYRGGNCSGCIQGKMRDHSRVRSTKNHSFEPGDAMGGDLIFVDGRFGKLPSAVLVDLKTGFTSVSHLANKAGNELLKALRVAKGLWRVYNHTPKFLYFDRERGLEAIADLVLDDLGMVVKLTAANQHLGKVEVMNRLIRETVRSVKSGIYDAYNYKVPIQWNRFFISDAVDVINRRIPVGHNISPYTAFTGLSHDRQRDFRVDLGHPIIAKRAKTVSANLNREGLWAVPIRRYMNGQGTLLVYIVESKSYRHILKFRYAKIPSWVISGLQSIPESQPIKFDIDDEGPPPLTSSDLDSEDSGDEREETTITTVNDDTINDAINTVESLEAQGADISQADADDLREARDVLREAYHELADEPEAPIFVERVDPLPDEVNQPVEHERGAPRELRNLELWGGFVLPTAQPDEQGDPDGPRRSTRERKQIKPHNVESFNIWIEQHYVLFEQALRSDKKQAALAALDKELDVAELMKIWDPIFEKDIPVEERKYIIDAMTNYVEKYFASGGFDKAKARVLARGDQQTEFGDTSSPVCRTESVFLIAIIAAFLDLEIFKFDVVSAYLNTIMPQEIVHKWLLLPRHVSRRLVERDSDRYREFLREDGKILVKMNKLTYGYKEAALGWFKTFMELFMSHGYEHMPKDPCFLYKLGKRDGDILLSAICVDDGFGAATRGSGMKEEYLDAIRSKFDIKVEEKDTIDFLGMTLAFDRVNKSVSISQRNYVEKLVKTFGVTKSARTPSLADLFEEDPASPLLKDQMSFLSLNSSCSYAATRTFPEILPCSSTLAGRYYKATEQDFSRGIRMIEYMKGEPDHELYLRPRSLKVVGYADASYAERSSGHSQTGGCVGFEGYTSPCMFIFLSSKQPIVAKSSCEAELIAANTVGDYFVWLRECLETVKLAEAGPATLYQDNQATILIGEKGMGSFKRTKHIRVRFFWITELIKSGELELKHVPTGEMIADILTKPLVGNSFRYLRDKLIGKVDKPEDM